MVEDLSRQNQEDEFLGEGGVGDLLGGDFVFRRPKSF